MNTSALDLRDLTRICRDLAWSEITSMPSMAAKLGARSSSTPIDWAATGLALDSLACMQLATPGATWCNAFETGYEDLFLAKRNVIAWAAENLPWYANPCVFTYGLALPRGSIGKLCDWPG